MGDFNEIRPQPGPQEEFLATPADIAIYGGSAGGGKTWALALDPLRYIKSVPGFGAVIFRRSFPEITSEGGIWDESFSIYPHLGGRPILGDLEWRFPPYGNTISFCHLQHPTTVQDWQSSQIACMEYDELTHFTESQFWFMVSRSRSTCGVRPYIRGACNPHPNWVKDLLAPWVDDEFEGVRAASGELRWFVRVGGKLQWVPEGTPKSKSLVFIRASVYDNKILLQKDPGYLDWLESLPPVLRARLLRGDWNAREEGLVYSGFDACIVESAPQVEPTVGGIDWGFRNPFAAVWGHVDYDDVLWITGCRSVRQTTMPTHAEAIPRGVRWWCDPAEPGLIAELRNLGHEARSCVHIPVRGASGEVKKPLLAGIDQVSRRIRSGGLKIVRRACLPLIRSLGLYHYDPEKQSEDPVKEDDHEVDALRYLIVGLDRGRAPAGSESSGASRLDQEGMWS